MLKAVEKQKEISAAVKAWSEKFADGAELLPGMNKGVYWHSRLGIWGHFGGWSKANGIPRYWNVFGTVPTRFRKNLVVEINPTGVGIDKTSQGLFARSDQGELFLLHKGRMAIPSARISEEDFDQASSWKRVPVEFSDGSVSEYFLVANLKESARSVQNQVASFVSECRRIRLYYSVGSTAATDETAVDDAESNPEKQGSIYVPARDSTTANRIHADVWHALVRELDAIGAKHSNGRVGRLGPDLRTIGKKPVLFEIKVTTDAADLQQAMGQLFLYENLLQKTYRKVLVFPEGLSGRLMKAASDLDLEVLQYKMNGKSIQFDRSALKNLVS